MEREIKMADMPEDMRDDAFRVVKEALSQPNLDLETKIAQYIKNEFDKLHGSGWQCVVGMRLDFVLLVLFRFMVETVDC
jgi:hypothetical protein